MRYLEGVERQLVGAGGAAVEQARDRVSALLTELVMTRQEPAPKEKDDELPGYEPEGVSRKTAPGGKEEGDAGPQRKKRSPSTPAPKVGMGTRRGMSRAGRNGGGSPHARVRGFGGEASGDPWFSGGSTAVADRPRALSHPTRYVVSTKLHPTLARRPVAIVIRELADFFYQGTTKPALKAKTPNVPLGSVWDELDKRTQDDVMQAFDNLLNASAPRVGTLGEAFTYAELERVMMWALGGEANTKMGLSVWAHLEPKLRAAGVTDSRAFVRWWLSEQNLAKLGRDSESVARDLATHLSYALEQGAIGESRLLGEDVDENELLQKFNAIARSLGMGGGWRTLAPEMRHGMAVLTVKHNDGRAVEVRKDRMSSRGNESFATGVKLSISPVYEREERGGGWIGVGYNEKTPSASVSLKDPIDPAKVAKRIKATIERKILPKYTEQWQRGKEIQQQRGAARDEEQSLIDQFKAAAPGMITDREDNRGDLYLKLPGEARGMISTTPGYLGLKLSSLTPQQVISVLRALK